MRFSCLALGAFLLSSPAVAQQAARPAAQPDASAPQVTTATYQDWLVRCEVRTEPPAGKVCEASQGLQAQGQQGLIARIVVGRTARSEPVKLIVQLPATVWLPANVTFYSDEKGPGLPLTFKRCLQGCLADLDLKADQVQALRGRTAQGRIEFEVNPGQKTTLPFSFNGFQPALDAALNG